MRKISEVYSAGRNEFQKTGWTDEAREAAAAARAKANAEPRARRNPTPGTKSYESSVRSAGKDVDSKSTRGTPLRDAVHQTALTYGVDPADVHEQVRTSNNLSKEEYQTALRADDYEE